MTPRRSVLLYGHDEESLAGVRAQMALLHAERTEAAKAARAADEPARPDESRGLRRGELAALPTVAPLVDGVLDRRALTVLAGPWGVGKSFAAVGLAASVATGVPWAGREVSAPGRVVYVAAEGLEGLHGRLSAWEEHHGQSIPDDRLTVWPGPVDLTDPVAVAGLAGLAAGARLVVFDPLARCIPGVDENDAGQVGMIVAALDRVRLATDGGALLVVHVSSRGGASPRGSSALEAAADLVWRAQRSGEVLELTASKARHRTIPGPVWLGLADVPPSVVAVASEAPAVAAPTRRRAAK